MTVIIFDSETDSKDIAQSRIIDAAWLTMPNTPADALTSDVLTLPSQQQLYNPDRPISPATMAIHHIIDCDVASAPSYNTFALPADTSYLIGHNIDFDWQVAGSPANIRRICTLALARKLWPNLDSHAQVSLIYTFMPQTDARNAVKSAHTALQDVHLCFYLLQTILKELQNRNKLPSSWEQLWQWSEAARIPTVLSFGKHKGQLITDLPIDYIQWFLRQNDIDQFVRIALEKEIHRRQQAQ